MDVNMLLLTFLHTLLYIFEGWKNNGVTALSSEDEVMTQRLGFLKQLFQLQSSST